jgi:rhodanese-related sulfurtransferase
MDTAASHSSHAVSATALHALLGSAQSPCLLDVRKAPAFDAAEFTLPGVLRCAPEQVAEHLLLLRGRQVVTCCVHGHQVSQIAAQTLRNAGIEARFLADGIEGWHAAGLPVMGKQADCGMPSTLGQPSRWITRERPKIARIACPWLIRRFIDPQAQFFYVPADPVGTRAASLDAIAYYVPDVRFSHRGEACSFDAFIEDFGLRDASLDALAAIVRGADTGRPGLTPQSAGLLAISLGLSANFHDDHVMLEHGMVIYDALYAWLKTAANEVHNADLFRNNQ